MARSERGVGGNFQQKKYAVNPISYLRERGINSVFRYVQTHPDMDHMDGIEAFFETFSPLNFWDTNNQEEKTFGVGSQYNERDWRFYKQIRETSPRSGPKTTCAQSREQWRTVQSAKWRRWLICPRTNGSSDC